MIRGLGHIVFMVAVLAALSSCSTTRRLADGQTLYTGVRKIEIEFMEYETDSREARAAGNAVHDTLKASGGRESSGIIESSGGKKASRPRAAKVPGSVEAAVESALSVRPNNPLWSPYVRTPLPTGLWVWNYMYTDKKKGFGAWIYRTFGKQPVILEQHVRPEARTGMVEDILDNFGYFGSEATYEIVPKKNPKKARVSYSVAVARPWFYETVEFPPVRDTVTAVIAPMQARSKTAGKFFARARNGTHVSRACKRGSVSPCGRKTRGRARGGRIRRRNHDAPGPVRPLPLDRLQPVRRLRRLETGGGNPPPRVAAPRLNPSPNASFYNFSLAPFPQAAIMTDTHLKIGTIFFDLFSCKGETQ